MKSREKKHRVLKSDILNLAEDNRVKSLSLLFCHSSSNAVSILACTQTLFNPLRWRSINRPRFLFLSRALDFEEKIGVCVHPCILCYPLIAFPPQYRLFAGFKLPITRTFFDFPKRFELSGVNCNQKISHHFFVTVGVYKPTGL